MEANNQDFTFKPIGVVESPFKEKFGTPRQPGLVASTRGAIVLRKDLNPDALDGLKGFSHLWVIFVFHENGGEFRKTKVHPPRLEGQALGVFATRSPHRPNPIGLSLVKVEKIDGRRIEISGLDIIDGTPVLDIKPYLANIESVADATNGWAETLPETTVQIEWSDAAVADLERAFDSSETAESTRAAIEGILARDPRPVAYRGTTETPNPYTDRYGFRHGNFNVVYRMISSPTCKGAPLKLARVEAIEVWSPVGV